MWCTTNKGKKVVVSLTLLTMTESAVFNVMYNRFSFFARNARTVVTYTVVPATILIINLIDSGV